MRAARLRACMAFLSMAVIANGSAFAQRSVGDLDPIVLGKIPIDTPPTKPVDGTTKDPIPVDPRTIDPLPVVILPPVLPGIGDDPVVNPLPVTDSPGSVTPKFPPVAPDLGSGGVLVGDRETRIALGIDRFEPSVAREGEVIHAFFTLRNDVGRSTTGRIRASLFVSSLGKTITVGSWPISGLPSGSAASGAIRFIAPNAAANHRLRLEYHETGPLGVILPSSAAAAVAEKAFTSSARYFVRMDGFYAKDIRSTFDDTDSVFFEVRRNGDVLYRAPTYPGNPDTTIPRSIHIKNVDDGESFALNLDTPLFDASPDDTGLLNFSYLIFNGDPASYVNLAESLAGILTGLGKISWFDCDGIVAEADVPVGLGSLHNLVSPGGAHSETRSHYYSLGWGDRFCGSSSEYQVTTSIHRSAGGGDLVISPDNISLTPGQVRQFTVNPPIPVTWSVEGSGTNGVIDAFGNFVLPVGFPANGSVTIRAAASDGSGRSAVAVVTGPSSFFNDIPEISGEVAPGDGDSPPVADKPPVPGGPVPIPYPNTDPIPTPDPPKTPSILSGDLTNDGRISVADATLALRIAVGSLSPGDAQRAAADTNRDGRIGIADVILILRLALGL